MAKIDKSGLSYSLQARRTHLLRVAVYLLAFLFISSLCYRAVAQATESHIYKSGYLAAYFAQRWNRKSLDLIDLADNGSLRLNSSTCWAEDERTLVRQDLTKSGIVREIVWKIEANCDNSEATEFSTQALPSKEFFPPAIADPRALRFSMRLQYYRAPRGSFNAGMISAGDQFPLANFDVDGEQQFQLSIAGGIFSIFDLGAKSSDLVNSDFIFGIPLSFKSRNFSSQLRLYHQSSHLGDEFLLGNPNFKRINLSYEDIELLAAYQFSYVRVYGGASAIVRSEPELDPFRVQSGLEFEMPLNIRSLSLVAAADFQSRQELNWKLDSSLNFGLSLGRIEIWDQRRLRMLFEYFDGSSPNGQFFRESIRYLGFGVFIDL